MQYKPLLYIDDTDIFPSVTEADKTIKRDRKASKVILLDENNNILLTGREHRLLPGGGLEIEESFEDAAIRECKEEVGYDIQIIGNIGFTEEFRAEEGRYQITYCFVAKIVGEQSIPTTTEEEEQGLIFEWLSVEDAISLLEKQKSTFTEKDYNGCFNVRTQLAFLSAYKNKMLLK